MKSPTVLARTALVVANSSRFVTPMTFGVRCCSLELKTAVRSAWTHRTVGTRTGKGDSVSVSHSFTMDSTSASTPPSAGNKDVAHRIYEIVGREFDVGKPSILSKVIFDDMRVADPRERTKSRSVSMASLSAILETEDDPIKRELLQLVLDWLSAKAMEKRGGFIALGAKVADMPEWTSRVIPDHDDLPVDASALPVVLIDGHYIIFRSFYAMPTLTAPDGTPVGALVGFCNFLNKLVLRPWADGSYPHRRIVVAFDTGMDTFRHKLYPGYKADRAEAPEDLRPYASALSAVKAIGTQLRDPINSGLTRWRLTVYVDTTVESERDPVSKHQLKFSLSVENEQADAGRDGRIRLAKPNSQALLRTGTGGKKAHVQLTTSRIGNHTRPQFALIKRACEAYGLDVFESQGYEADDVIASLAFQAVTAGATNVTIVSADKDLSQLVTRRVRMFNYYTGEMLGPEEVLSGDSLMTTFSVLTKFLAPPGRLADLLAIAGDKADGIRGAEGYGPVTAAKVLARHANLEDALDEICSIMLKKKRDPALISDTREQVLLARRIVELCSTVPLKSRQGCKSLHTQAPYGLTPGDGASYLLDFMRNAGMPDLLRRTAQILGVNEDGSRIL